MSAMNHARQLLWPTVLVVLSVGLALFQVELTGVFGDSEMLALSFRALAYFAAAWLAGRLVAVALDQTAGRRRPYPRLLKDMFAALFFMAAFAATVALVMGEGAVGALAGSGIILALIGFAIRNVVADTLSGVALGVEGPFRIGDWIDIDKLALGKVIEIGWRTTRILTADSTYLILPNSQIARQRITNYSAPRPHYRAQIAITLDHTMPIGTAREIMQAATRGAKLIQQDPAPDIRVQSYDEGGITYAVRYWVSRFERHVDCRDEVYSVIDKALRDAGIVAPHRRIELVRAHQTPRPAPFERAEPIEADAM
ncbi:mechanosensitive ion channel family protein [Pikeienuella piscinae]|uniref:Small-conductance mechanosensitive channel n=1 Tax=Pikeienuella piscinae TaxID=2748098 RepID=A0A7L5BUQ1_9RHOB|nr:mechanosensitive ion channel domain-containing protein [Pikeienuella piscinae]QIE54137.1 mechanosensitive ion channel family protein [Pikeienuella piscinae]